MDEKNFFLKCPYNVVKYCAANNKTPYNFVQSFYIVFSIHVSKLTNQRYKIILPIFIFQFLL